MPWRAARLLSLRSWKPMNRSGGLLSFMTASTSMKSLGGPNPVPTSCTRRKVSLPEVCCSPMSASFARSRKIGDPDENAVVQAGAPVVQAHRAATVEGCAERVEHSLAGGLVVVGPELEPKEPAGFGVDRDDNLGVELVVRRSEPGAHIVDAQKRQPAVDFQDRRRDSIHDQLIRERGHIHLPVGDGRRRELGEQSNVVKRLHLAIPKLLRKIRG